MAVDPMKQKYGPIIHELMETRSRLLETYGKLRSQIHDNYIQGIVNDDEELALDMAINMAFQKSQSLVADAQYYVSTMEYREFNVTMKNTRKAEGISKHKHKGKEKISD